MYPNPPVARKTITIANGSDTSAAFDLEHYPRQGVVWPTMTAATATFLVCDTTDGTYVELVNTSGAAISVTVSSGKAMTLPAELAPWRHAKLKGNLAEAAARSIQLILKN